MAQKLWLGSTDRTVRQQQIDTLDPARDYMAISQLFYADFQSIMMPLPFAGFMMTFAAPRMSRILAGTGELSGRFAKRAVDTMLFSKLVTANGLDSDTGRDAARRVNQMHARYDIHEDDFIAVGCDPALYSLELAEKFGWRPVSDKEREAMRNFHGKQARAFGSRRPIPPSIPEMKAFLSRYFDTQLGYEPQNHAMAIQAIEWFANLAPAPLRPVMRAALPALLDHRVVRACGLKPANSADRLLARVVMGTLSRRDPVPDGAPDRLEGLARTVYPNGWTVDKLGPQDHGEAAGSSRRSGASADPSLAQIAG